MIKLYVRRKIAAAHFLPGYPGKCKNMHGHTWLIEVWLEGEVDPETGMVVDFKKVKGIIDYHDHRVLNETLLSVYQPPTAENLAQSLLYDIPFCYRVRVWESEDAYAEASADPITLHGFLHQDLSGGKALAPVPWSWPGEPEGGRYVFEDTTIVSSE